MIRGGDLNVGSNVGFGFVGVSNVLTRSGTLIGSVHVYAVLAYSWAYLGARVGLRGYFLRHGTFVGFGYVDVNHALTYFGELFGAR